MPVRAAKYVKSVLLHGEEKIGVMLMRNKQKEIREEILDIFWKDYPYLTSQEAEQATKQILSYLHSQDVKLPNGESLISEEDYAKR